MPIEVVLTTTDGHSLALRLVPALTCEEAGDSSLLVKAAQYKWIEMPTIGCCISLVRYRFSGGGTEGVSSGSGSRASSPAASMQSDCGSTSSGLSIASQSSTHSKASVPLALSPTFAVSRPGMRPATVVRNNSRTRRRHRRQFSIQQQQLKQLLLAYALPTSTTDQISRVVTAQTEARQQEAGAQSGGASGPGSAATIPYGGLCTAGDTTSLADNISAALQSLTNRLAEVPRTQAGSKFLQAQLQDGGPPTAELILQRVRSDLPAIMTGTSPTLEMTRGNNFACLVARETCWWGSRWLVLLSAVHARSALRQLPLLQAS